MFFYFSKLVVFFAGELPFIVVDVGFNPLPLCFCSKATNLKKREGHQRSADARNLQGSAS